jgi:hypothetical protein
MGDGEGLHRVKTDRERFDSQRLSHTQTKDGRHLFLSLIRGGSSRATSPNPAGRKPNGWASGGAAFSDAEAASAAPLGP